MFLMLAPAMASYVFELRNLPQFDSCVVNQKVVFHICLALPILPYNW